MRFEYFQIRPVITYTDFAADLKEIYPTKEALDLGIADALASGDTWELTWRLYGMHNDGDGRYEAFEIGEYPIQDMAEEVMKAILDTMRAARDLIDKGGDIKGITSGPEMASAMLTECIERSAVFGGK